MARRAVTKKQAVRRGAAIGAGATAVNIGRQHKQITGAVKLASYMGVSKSEIGLGTGRVIGTHFLIGSGAGALGGLGAHAVNKQINKQRRKR